MRSGGAASRDTDDTDQIAFSPDGAYAAVAGGGVCHLMEVGTWRSIRKLEEPWHEGRRDTLRFPAFAPDGRHLLLLCGQLSLRVYEVGTWQRVQRLPEAPEDAMQYVPAEKLPRAVVRTVAGQVLLWDSANYRAISTLDEGVFIAHAAFSPDESLVAVATARQPGYSSYWGTPRLRLWRSDTGDLVAELRPFERESDEKIEGLQWSPDGRYVLAVTKSSTLFTSRGISVFNVRSGRHRGEFGGCPTAVRGIALLPDAGQLIAGCNDGKIRFWDFAAAMKQIQEFEASLADGF